MSSNSNQDRIRRRSFLRLAGTSGAVGAGTMLAGCLGGDDGSGTETDGDATDTEAEGTETETAEPDDIQTGGELVVAMQSDIETLHPHKVPNTTGITMCENLGNSLYRVTSEGEVVPDLAADMPTVSSDGLTYTVPIREGVTFHAPYDREMTAEDVVQNFRTILDSDYGAYGRGAYVGTLVGEGIDPQETVQQTGEYEVTFDLDSPFAPFLFKQASMSAFAWFTILPMEAVEEHGEDFGNPNNGSWATGPFTFNHDETQVGSEYVFDANPDYFREGAGGQLPYVDRLIYRIVPEASVRNTQLQSGEIDVSESVSATEVDTMSENSGVVVKQKASTAKTSQWLNIVNYEPFTNVDVRKAMMYAMNREAIVTSKFEGNATVAHSMLPPWHWAYNKDACVVYETDVEQAQSLLSDAGYGDGFEFSCEPTNQPKFVDVATILQQQYQQVGLDMSVEPRSKVSAFEPIAGSPAPSDWQSTVENFTWGFAADDYAYATFHSDAAFNYNHYSDDEADQLMEESRSTVGREARQEVFNEIQQKITNDMPKLFLLWNSVIHGHRASVNNLRVWPSAYMWFEDVWTEQ